MDPLRCTGWLTKGAIDMHTMDALAARKLRDRYPLVDQRLLKGAAPLVRQRIRGHVAHASVSTGNVTPDNMRKIRKRKGKVANSSEEPQLWDPQQVIARINRARGDYLSRTGREIGWKEVAKLLKWSPSTQTDVTKDEEPRPLRLREVALIARLLEVRAGWLAFGEDPVRDAPPETLMPRSERPLVTPHRPQSLGREVAN